jgi:hypothetical protein
LQELVPVGQVKGLVMRVLQPRELLVSAHGVGAAGLDVLAPQQRVHLLEDGAAEP